MTDDEPLEQRRARQRELDRNEVATLKDEVENLVTEVHKLRGTLQAYSPTKDVDRRLGVLEAKMREERKQEADTLWDRIHRRTVVFWATVGMFILLLFAISYVFSTVQRSFDRSIELACEHRKELEMTLSDFLVDAADRATDPARKEELLLLAEDIQSPSCDTLLNGAPPAQ